MIFKEEKPGMIQCPVCMEWVPHYAWEVESSACARCHEELGAETRTALRRWNLKPEKLPF